MQASLGTGMGQLFNGSIAEEPYRTQQPRSNWYAMIGIVVTIYAVKSYVPVGCLAEAGDELIYSLEHMLN